MKKFATTSLICIYALATMGFSLNEFYCCGKLKTISITVANDGKDKCNKADSNTDGCCKNKCHYFKVKDNHVTSAEINLPVTPFARLHPYNTSLQDIIFCSQKIAVAYRSNAPPLYSLVPIYISNCTYRI